MKMTLRILLILAAFLPMATKAEFQTWTNTQGRTIIARPIAKTDQAITVERVDGKRFDLIVTDLIDADRAWIKNWKPIEFHVSSHGPMVNGKTPWFTVTGPTYYSLYFPAQDLAGVIKALKEFQRLAAKAETEHATELNKTILARPWNGSPDPQPVLTLAVDKNPVLRGEWVKGGDYTPEQVTYLIDYLEAFSPEKFDAELKRVQAAVQ